MKTVIIHDYLITFGGAEKVLLELCKIFPDAPVYVLIYRPELLGVHKHKFANIKVRQSWFGYLPFAEKLISPLRFLLPLFWKSFNTKQFDLIVSSASWAVTKGFDKKEEAKEICYCHTPPRFLYGYDTSRKWDGKWYGGLVSLYALLVNHFLRIYDFKRAQRVDLFIANSKNVQRRIKKFYKKDAVVVYPPIDVEKIVKVSKKVKKENYYLTGGRLVASKNFDLVINACKKAKVYLKVYGSGPELENLIRVANGNAEFLGHVEDEKLIKLYAQAKAFIASQKDEDFGMTLVESMASGTPVIAYGGGGYLESVDEKKSGVFFNELSVESIAQAIKRLKKMNFDKLALQNHARKFSTREFEKNIRAVVKRVVKK